MNKMTKIALIECTFDATFYLACYADILPKKVDPLNHYNKIGWKEGLNPNPYFSTNLYLEANPDVLKAGENPFEHFINSHPGSHPYVSPIFDPVYYVTGSSDVRHRAEAVNHYWETGRLQGRSPSALFDVSHYRSQLKRTFKDPLDCLTHYLTTGWKQDLSPHPLFDPDFYRSQLSGPAAQIPPLVHYLEAGWRLGLSPHVLFDPAYYIQNTPEASREPPLVHYLKRSEWTGTPHYLFSDTFYTAAVKRSSLCGSAKDYRGGPPLLHYCRIGARQDIPPHPLFDLQHYTAQAQKAIRTIDEPDVALARLETNPLQHYCEMGFEMNLSPTPYFDPDFYRSQFSEKLSGDPLRHYLSVGFGLASPHPAIDLDYYASQVPEFLPHELPVVLDLLMTEQDQRVSPHPFFDRKFYLERNRDIKDGSICPILHFLEHGMKEARQPNPLFSYPYAHRLCQPGKKRFGNPVDGYFRARGHERTRVLFLGHDASRSGAPLVLLALVKELSAIADIECITILGAGGSLVDDFVDVSLTYIAENQDREFLEWNRHSPVFRAEMSAIASLLEDNPPELVICNSLESRHLADFFVSYGFGPLVTLVHEVADPYDGEQVARLLDASELSVFVSEYQLDRMRKKLVFDEAAVEIVLCGWLPRCKHKLMCWHWSGAVFCPAC